MNTKGIKFLAVLAVMVMAFAAVIVLAPVDNDAVYEDVCDKSVARDKTLITAEMTEDITKFYYSDDASVKITGLSNPIKIFVQNGKEVELNIKPVDVDDEGETIYPSALTEMITVYSVTSDQQRHTTSTVDGDATEPAVSEGKIVLTTTELTFLGQKGQTVVYKAMMPYYVDTYTTSINGKVVKTDVTTLSYAIISADKVLTTATIGSQVTIASGQFIEVDEGAVVYMDTYGIYVADIEEDEDDNTYTYYAVGANAGTFEMNDEDDLVVVLDGSINVKNGTASLKAASVTSDDGVEITNADSNLVGIEGEIETGTVTASGAVLFDEVYVDSSASVIVNNNTTVDPESVIRVEGKLYLKTDKDKIEGATFQGETGTIYAQNPKLWKYTEPEDPLEDPEPYIIALPEDIAFHGLIDTTAINETAKVTDRFASAVIERNQTFRVVGDVTVSTGLTVKGVLIIDEGASVTISKSQNYGAVITLEGQYGQIINNGQLNISTTSNADQGRPYGLQIKGGYGENNGMITANSDTHALKAGFSTFSVAYADDDDGYGKYFINNGTINAGRNDTVSFDENFINAGSFTVGGVFSSGDFYNYGLFTINNAKVIGDLGITLSPLASVNIIGAEIEATDAAGITIFSEGGDYVEIKTSTDSGAAAGEYFTVRGVKVTDNSIPDFRMYSLDLSGSIGVNKAGTADGYAILTLDGTIDITSSALIGDKVVLKGSGVDLNVYGDLTLSKRSSSLPTGDEAKDTLSADLDFVSGKVTSVESRVTFTNYVAAKYVLPSDGTSIYTTLEAAVPAAEAANVNSIDVGQAEVWGEVTYPTLLTDLTIPAGMYVNGFGLTIGNALVAPVVKVEAAASFNFDNIYLYEGQILAANANDVNESTVHADVKLVNTTTYTGNYMSLRVAIEEMPGQTIYLSQDFESISRDLTIPAGTTVVAIDDDTGDKYFTMIDSNLYVDGILIVNDFWFIATTDDTKGIYVSGTIMDRHSDGDCFDGWWYMPEGVSYQLTLPDKYGNDETWFVITSLDRLQESINIADESKVNIEGSPKLGDISVYGTEDEPAEITFKGDINAGTITMDNVIIKGLDGNKVTATFADDLGSITIIGAYVDNKMSIFSLGDKGVYMDGALTDDYDGTYLIRFDGLTGIDGTTKAVIGWGYYDEGTPSILFNGVTTAVGKKVLISNTDDEYDDEPEGMVTVTGILSADNTTKIVMYTDVQVLGGLYAAERTETATAGSIEIYGDLFVGALMSDIYNAEDADFAYADDGFLADETVGYGHYMNPVAPQPNVAGAATVSGKVTVADDRFITVAAGADVEDIDYIDDLESMDIVIEGDLWLTVYGLERYSMDGLKAPIFNAKVDKILDVYGNEVAKFSNKYKVIYGCPALDLGDTGMIAISLNYEAFTVTIKTDGSVKAVYIDGILMYTGENRNTFELDKITAGTTHKVTVEAATGYDADKCVLYTDMGTILPGMAFTFSETDCIYDEDGFNTYNIVYNINGTEIQPEPVPPTPEEESQWTITTILLVILVVLIAIMAVIVALRLNRS